MTTETQNQVQNENETFCDQFLAAFPKKSSSAPDAGDYNDTWMRVIDGAPTTGEGCIINGLPVMNTYDSREPTYILGVLKEVHDWAYSLGYFPEPADAGTLKFYKI